MFCYRLAGLLLSVCVSVPNLHAQLSPKVLLQMPQFGVGGEFSASPDGSLVAYLVKPANARPDTKGTAANDAAQPGYETELELWLTDVRTGSSNRICCAEGGSILRPRWSPDGKYLAFYRSKKPLVLSEEGLQAFSEQGSLAIWSRETGTVRDFPRGGLASRFEPVWLKDGHSLLLRTRPSNDLSSQQGGNSPRYESTPSPSETDKSADPTIRVLSTEVQGKGAKSSSKQGDTVDRRNRKLLRCDVAIVDIRSGDFKLVLRGINLSSLALSPDGKRFVFAEYKGVPLNSYFETRDIHLLDLESFQDRMIFSDDVVYAGLRWQFSWSPDGRYLAFPHESKDEAGWMKFDLILLDLSDGSWRRIRAGPEPNLNRVDRTIWSADGDYFSFVRDNQLETWTTKRAEVISKVSIPSKNLLGIVSIENNRELERAGPDYSLMVKVRDRETLEAGFWRIWPLSTRAEKLVEAKKGFAYYFDYQELLAGGSEVLFIWESVDRPSELYAADRNFKNVRRLTNLSAGLDGVVMGYSEVVAWRDNDGQERKGALLLPAGYQPGRRYPLIVGVYPREQVESVNLFGLNFNFGPYMNRQLFATRGYVVFQPNIPYVGASPKSRMPDIAKSVLPGIQKVIDMGIADPDRIGVTGVSEGGYTTLALLVQSKLFKAGVMISGYGNLLELYSYDVGTRLVEESYHLKTNPWENREIFIQNSPYFYLDRVQSPLLILAGSADDSIPSRLGEGVFTGLRRLGKVATFVEYEGEGHAPDLYSVPHQLDLCDRVIGWFDKYLKAEASPQGPSSPRQANPH